jgi:hypothetical protein
MELKNMSSGFKGFLGGVVGGLLLALVIGFGFDLVVTEAKLALEKHDAKVVALAEACEKKAVNHWQDQGKALAELEGFTNEDRKLLAQRFSVNIDGDERVMRQIVEACDDALRNRAEA